MPYGKLFYSTRRHGARESARMVLPYLFHLLSPRSIVDVGCGSGVWIAEAMRLGLKDAWGVDGPWVKPEDLDIPLEAFHPIDFEKPWQLGRTFDLAISLEVGEHLSDAVAQSFVQNLCSLAPVVMFSAAIPGQGGLHHVNEQWPSYWIARFESAGYRLLDPVRGRFWNEEKVSYWYRQNILIFVAAERMSDYPLLVENDRLYGMGGRDLVHPRHAERALQYPNAFSLLKALPVALVRTIASLPWARGG